MLRRAFFTISVLLSWLITTGQNTGRITGKITDSLQRPLEGATVLLLTNDKDVTVKTALSDAKGTFVLEKIKSGTYKLIVSITGFRKETTAGIVIQEEDKNNI